MNSYLEDRAEFLNSDAIQAIDHALDVTPNRENCEAWYEAIEAVLLRQYPNGNEKIEDALDFVRKAIDERFG